MMIVNHIPELVAQKFGEDEVVALKVQQATGLTYATVQRWLKNQAERADFDVLEAWCKYLDCTVGDLLEYKPD